MHDPLQRFHDEWARARPGEAWDGSRAVLATASAQGRPSARYVLVKEADETGFYFYTNFGSRKSQELRENPFAALTWHWDSTGVQVRIEGSVIRAPAERSDAYFSSRPRESQLGAWASEQSRVMPDGQALVRAVEGVRERFAGQDVPRPETWGGWALTPDAYEFWFDRPARLHDRHRYRRNEGGSWTEVQLFP